LAKIRNFDSFGAVFSHFCPNKREIWHGGADVYPGNVSLLRGEKPMFGPLSKNNTGIALRGGLLRRPASKKTSHFFVYSRRETQDPHHTWHGDRGSPSHFCTPIFFDPMLSFAATAIENLRENTPTAENAYILLVCPPKATKLKT